MALRALLFSKSPEPADALAAVFKVLGIGVEVCSDIFSAIKKGTQQDFSCLIVDWSDQPESNFLLKRARESAPNRNAVAIAIVDNEPAPGELHENKLDFLLYRPIAIEEARAVLAKACQEMQSAAVDAEVGGSLRQGGTASSSEPTNPSPVSLSTEVPNPQVHAPRADFLNLELQGSTWGGEPSIEEEEPARSRPVIRFRTICAAVLVIAAAFCLWRSRQTILYLVETREGTFHALRASMAALLQTNHSGAQPAGSLVSDAQQDAYFAGATENTDGNLTLGLVWAQVNLPQAAVRLPKAFNFPLPTPGLMRSDPPPLHVPHPQVPESLRGAAAIGPPVIATGGQMLPVSTPVPQIPQVSEPVRLSEAAARAMLVHSIDPVYPPEALAQKLQGPVVLQAMIGRDGNVEDLKIVRGYFVLGRAAIAAVKHWRFQPYNVNGHPAETQTVLTVNFSRPQN
jgi:TonB family protein